MCLRAVCLLLLGLSISSGQQPPVSLKVRSIVVRLVPTSSQPPAPISFDVIAKALQRRSVNLRLEETFDPAQLPRVSEVIRDLYVERGRQVRVERSVTALPPNGVEVAFEVIELCACD